MQPAGILETCLYVDDLDAAQGFYERVLGLKVYARVEGRHVFFRCGDGMLLLFDPEVTSVAISPDISPHGAHGPGHVAFRMGQDEVETWKRKLDEENVEIESELEWPNGGLSLYFRDPAGNSLEFATPRLWGMEK